MSPTPRRVAPAQDERDQPPGLRFAVGGIALALGIAALHFGQNLLAPLVLAALLAFALGPAVTHLRRWRLPPVAAVALVLAGTLTVIATLGIVTGLQLASLSRDLPRYQDTVREKLRALRPTAGGGPLHDGLRLLGIVEGELNAAQLALAPPSKTIAPAQRVRVEAVPVRPLYALAQLAVSALLPLAQFGLVVVLVFFMLLQRHEIRDRLLGLLGQDLARSADALTEAAQRVSRYLIAQLLVNTAFALPLGLGLWAIGVPAAWLWALMGGLLRFVPYLGLVVAALGPIILAFAVDPGWQMVIQTLLLIGVLELLLNNVIEPMAYGRSTGVSALAVLLSAGFWSLVWGPVGLALATPMTVCLVVLGRHLGPLRFLEQLLSSEPVFDAPTRLHQRLISGDIDAALEQAAQAATPEARLAFYDEAGVAVLRETLQARSAEHRHRVVSGMARLLDVLRSPADAPSGGGPILLCVGARFEADSLAAEMLADAAQLHGLHARALPASALGAERIGELPLDGVVAVCVCSFNPVPLAHTRFVLRRLRGRVPELPILLTALALEVDLDEMLELEPLGGVIAATSLKEALARLRSEIVRADSSADAGANSAPDSSHAGPADVAFLRTSSAQALTRCAQRALDVFVVDLATVSVRDLDGRLQHASAGVPGGRAIDTQALMAEGSALHAVLRDEQALCLPDLDREPEFGSTHAASREGMRFFAGAPVQDARGTTLGVLALHGITPRTLDDKEMALLIRMAFDVGTEMGAMLAERAAAGSAAEPAHA